MAYTSKYTGQQIDSTLGKVSIIENNVTDAQSDIDTILNTKIPNLSTRIDAIQSSLNSLSANLSMSFVDITVYNKQIGEINTELEGIQADLTAIFAELETKITSELFGSRIAELVLADEELSNNIAEGDSLTLQASQDLVNANTSRIVTLETITDTHTSDIANIKTDYATTVALNEKGSEILSSVSSTYATQGTVNTLNDTVNTLNSAIQTISGNYVTANDLNEKEQSIMNTVTSTYVTSTDLSAALDSYLPKSEITKTYATIQSLNNYVLKSTYESKIRELENAIKALQQAN